MTLTAAIFRKLTLFLLFSSTCAKAAQLEATLFHFAAAEADFLTASDGDLSTALGSDGVITVIGKSVTDEFGGHGTFDATWKESSDGVVFTASGTAYNELMSCSIDQAASSASCSFSNSVANAGTFTGEFTPSGGLSVLAVVTSSPEVTTVKSASSAPPTATAKLTALPVASSTQSGASSQAVSSSIASSLVVTSPVITSAPTVDPNRPFSFFGLAAAEAGFLTDPALSANRFTSVGTDGVIAVIGKGVTDAFTDHGTFDAFWQESSNGIAFQATGTAYFEVMDCTLDGGAATCSFSNSVSGQGTFTGTFEPTAVPFITTLVPGQVAVSEPETLATETSASPAPESSLQQGSTVAAPAITQPPSPLSPNNENGQFTLFGLAAAEAGFLTQPGVVTTVGTDGLITVIGTSVTDSFPDHGLFDATWVESANGVTFTASGTSYVEEMTCSVDQAAGDAACTFSNSVGNGIGTFTGTFEATAVQFIAVVTPGVTPNNGGDGVAPQGSNPAPPATVPAIISATFLTLATGAPVPAPAIVSATFLTLVGTASPVATGALATTSGFLTVNTDVGTDTATDPSETDGSQSNTQPVGSGATPVRALEGMLGLVVMPALWMFL